MIALIYAGITIVFLLVTVALYRKSRPDEPDELLTEKTCASPVRNTRWLDLSERLFDPSDARWLSEELAFPKLAGLLTRGRKRLAIQWLEALQASFDDLVRTPDFTPSDGAAVDSAGNWRLLWLTVRFKVLVSYALLMVKVFGPYHRLIPSFIWNPFTGEGRQRLNRVEWARNQHSR